MERGDEKQARARGRGGGGSDNLDNRTGYIFTSKGSRGPHQTRAPALCHDNYPFRHWLMGLKPARVLSEKAKNRERKRKRTGQSLDGAWYG